MRAQRWEWTHKYGMPLFLASVVAVILTGTSLIAVMALTGDPDDPPNPPPPPPAPPTAGPPPPPAPAPSPSPQESPPAPVVDLDPECVTGTWIAVQVVDIGFTGTWTLVGGEPVFEYRGDGNGTIDYGSSDEGNATSFEFEDLFGTTSNSVATGRSQFQYSVARNEVRHIYDVFNAARLNISASIPYVPNEDTFVGTCEGDTMTLDGDKGYVELRRR